MSIFIGVDPGKTGALAFLDDRGRIIEIHDMPVVANSVSPNVMADIIDAVVEASGDSLVDITAVVEHVHSMPKQGVASSFNFGKNYGLVLGVLAGARIRVEHFTPNIWKRGARLSADKEQARLRAIERWPGQTWMFTRKKDADRAEAALLALWFIDTYIRQGVA